MSHHLKMRIARAELSHSEHVHTGAAQLRLDLGRQALSAEPWRDHEGRERLDLEPDTVEIAEASAIVDLRDRVRKRNLFGHKSCNSIMLRR